MYFDSLHALINMDGHGMYVWCAYAVTLIVIIVLLIDPMRRRNRILTQVAAALQRDEGVPGAGAGEER